MQNNEPGDENRETGDVSQSRAVRSRRLKPAADRGQSPPSRTLEPAKAGDVSQCRSVAELDQQSGIRGPESGVKKIRPIPVCPANGSVPFSLFPFHFSLGSPILLVAGLEWPKVPLSLLLIAFLLLVGTALVAWWLYRKMSQLEVELERQRQLAFLGEITRGLAHEIRNPLNTIQINLQLVEESLDAGGTVDPERLRKRLGRVKSENLRLVEIINDFLRFSRPPKLKLERTELVDFMTHLVGFVRPEMNLMEIVVIEDYPEEPVGAWVDRAQLTQALVNLITNAKQAMTGPRKQLTISLASVKDQVRIGVADTGCGMSTEIKEKLFQPYVTTKEKGMGIGLAISQRIIDGHRGHIELASTSERGSEFAVWLPKEQR